MSQYIHCTNGRIRFKSKHLKSSPKKVALLQGQLLDHSGIIDATFNRHSASLTVKYDPELLCEQEVVSTIMGHFKLEAQVSRFQPSQNPSANEKTQANELGRTVAQRAGQIAAGMILERGVRYSVNRILGWQ